MRDFIAVKKADLEHRPEDIRAFIEELSAQRIPDYQTSAWLMATRLNGLTDEETSHLALEMARSGERLTWPKQGEPLADKHSSGGVGDKISLIVVPLLAALGFKVPKLSGRGLGHTGGTIDKLESIPGFSSDLTLDQIRTQLHDVGCCIASQTGDLAPADGILYALRDVTETVDSIPLIAASIMSKKIASSADVLVLDVKYGSGALVKTKREANRLGRLMVAIGESIGVKTAFLAGDMNEPLGVAIGNSSEVREAVDVLRGRGLDNVRRHSIALTAELMLLAGKAPDRRKANKAAALCLDSGRPLKIFREMVSSQGGYLNRLLQSPWPRKGYKRAEVQLPSSNQTRRLAAVDTEQLGRMLVELGGGRKEKGDRIDHHVGIEYLARLGMTVKPGEKAHLMNLVVPSATTESRLCRLREKARAAFRFE